MRENVAIGIGFVLLGTLAISLALVVGVVLGLLWNVL